jgi:hypothetical protein
LLLTAGKDRRLGTPDDRVVALRSAVYSPGARTVTLTPARKLALDEVFRLTAWSPVLTDLAANPLDGNGDGLVGDAFVATFRGRRRLS